MLVSKTDTTMSLSKVTSRMMSRTACSNSEILPRTCRKTRTLLSGVWFTLGASVLRPQQLSSGHHVLDTAPQPRLTDTDEVLGQIVFSWSSRHKLQVTALQKFERNNDCCQTTCFNRCTYSQRIQGVDQSQGETATNNV